MKLLKKKKLKIISYLLVAVISTATLFSYNITTKAAASSGTYYGINWDVDADGNLTLHAGTANTTTGTKWPTTIKTAKADGKVVLNENITQSMFNRHKNLTHVDTSNFDTSRVEHMNNMFDSCSSLITLDLSGFDTSKVKSMIYMFNGCTSLTELDLSGWNTSNVTDMKCMFNKCKSLTNLDLSGFDTSNARGLAAMFCSCNSLKTLDVSNFDTSNATDMNSMFCGCSSLKTLDLSKWNTSNVTNMYQMFYGCSLLKTLDISNFDTSKVGDMSFMFFNCSNLTTLDVSGFNTSNVTNMGNMFNKCKLLTDLDVSNFDTSNVTDMSSMFNGCSNLTTLDVSNFNTSKVKGIYYMFNGCSSLITLDLSGFDTNKVESMIYMFNDCKSLSSLDVSNFNTSNVANMYEMFYNCESLTDLDVSNFDTSKVTNMNSMFCSCDSLKTLDLSKWNTSNVTNMGWMFYNCESLTDLDISNFDTSNVANMQDFTPQNLKQIKIGLKTNLSKATRSNYNITFNVKDNKALEKAVTWDELCALSENPSETAGTWLACTHESTTTKKENEVPATCIQKGSYDEVEYCESCGAEIKRTTKETDIVDHTWDDGVTTDGVKTYTCTVCGETRKELDFEYNICIGTDRIKGIAIGETMLYQDITTADLPWLKSRHVHTAGTPVRENEVAATVNTEGGYDEVVYCSECHEELSRNHITISKKKAYTNTWKKINDKFVSYLWSDGINVYGWDSSNKTNYVLNKSTNSWEVKTWNGDLKINGYYLWNDGETIYYSESPTKNYVLNKSTNEWEQKTWIGLEDLDDFRGNNIWSDGKDIYYSSHNGVNLVLDRSTDTWITTSWNENIDGDNMWSDGDNVYYSNFQTTQQNYQYVLNKQTKTWEQKYWSGISYPKLNWLNGFNVWTDGINIYYSGSNIQNVQYVLNKETSTWKRITWNGATNFCGPNVCTDGENFYMCNGDGTYILE